MCAFVSCAGSPLRIPTLVRALGSEKLSVASSGGTLTFLRGIDCFHFEACLHPVRRSAIVRRCGSKTSFNGTISLCLFSAQLEVLVFSTVRRVRISLHTGVVGRFSLDRNTF